MKRNHSSTRHDVSDARKFARTYLRVAGKFTLHREIKEVPTPPGGGKKGKS